MIHIHFSNEYKNSTMPALNFFSGATFFFVVCLIVAGCKSNQPSENITAANDSTQQWKLGVALWTFHTVDFPGSLKQVDSAGLKYIEPNTFHKAGPALNDTFLGKLSPSGIVQLKQMINDHNLEVGSFYLAGAANIDEWKKHFEMAKQVGARFVTAEPPVDMWDSIDSLAGIYGLKVAIHEHWKGTSPYWHPDSVLAAIQGHPNFGACADLGHWPKSGINPVDAVKKLEGHILGIHLKDIEAYNNPELTDVRIGTGVVDFPAVFRELKRQNFNGFIYIEKDTQEPGSNVQAVQEAAKYYNEQVKKL
jgi:sugar phosphate isomerase/epimerase